MTTTNIVDAADPADQADWQTKDFSADERAPAPRPIINPQLEHRSGQVYFQGRRVLGFETIFAVEGGLAVATSAVKASVEIGSESAFPNTKREDVVLWFIGTAQVTQGISTLYVGVRGYGQAAAMMEVRALIKRGKADLDTPYAHEMMARALELENIIKANYVTKVGRITPHPDDQVFWKAVKSIISAARDALDHEICVITAASVDAEAREHSKKRYPL